MTVSDPHFDGVHSVMWLRLDSALRFSSHISLSFKPDEDNNPSSDGVLAHIGQGQNSGHDDFFSLALMCVILIKGPFIVLLMCFFHLIR